MFSEQAREQIEEYFERKRKEFDIPFEVQGTPLLEKKGLAIPC